MYKMSQNLQKLAFFNKHVQKVFLVFSEDIEMENSTEMGFTVFSIDRTFFNCSF